MYTTIALTVLTALAGTSVGSDFDYQVPKTPEEYAKAMKELGLTPRSGHLPVQSAADASPCKQCCKYLQVYLPNSAFNASSGRYSQIAATYWSAIQAEQAPSCYITPNDPNQVAGAVLTSEYYNCPFAVKSGGHAAFAGASNINNGFTIDLKHLGNITVSDNKKVTKVGTGNRWGKVYTALDPQGLTVIGGRVSEIGVGGLTLGGGISFFSGRHGWACDNVLNYQLVLGGGKVLEVNHTSYPDLYYALRGGGNNFGIVTRLDLETFAQGKMWGGQINYHASHSKKLLDGFTSYANNAATFPDAAMYLALVYANSSFFYASELTYALPKANPSIFADFYDIPNIGNTTKVQHLGDITDAINLENPSGLRETYTTATFALNRDHIEKMTDIFTREVQKLNGVKGLLPTITFQAITSNVVEKFSKRGGNALGISKSDTPLVLINVAAMWKDEADDKDVIIRINRIRRLCAQSARNRNLYNPYIYQNYASVYQKVMRSYGQDNLDKLRTVSKKYDPKQVFQQLQPGYFKL